MHLNSFVLKPPSKYTKYRTTIGGRASSLIHKAKVRAAKKGLDFDLDQHWCMDRLERCAVTGVAFVIVRGEGLHKHAPSIDRIDPTKGYLKTNCRLVTWIFNQAKNSYSDDELRDFAYTLIGASDMSTTEQAQQTIETIRKIRNDIRNSIQDTLLMSEPCEFWPDIVLDRIEENVLFMQPKTVAAAVEMTEEQITLLCDE